MNSHTTLCLCVSLSAVSFLVLFRVRVAQNAKFEEHKHTLLV
jgi:hypothetical protein